MWENYFDDRYEKIMCTGPIVKPNRITGEGRCKCRPWSASKAKDLKKKEHRKMARKSRRQNRRG